MRLRHFCLQSFWHVTTKLSNPSAPVPRVRQRVAALITQQGRVLLHCAQGDPFWALPGGGIEPGETAAQALVRELQEELGQAVEPGALSCVVENFFLHAGQLHHEIGLCLHASPLQDGPLANGEGPYEGVEGGRRLVFAWFSSDDLAHMDIRPTILRSYLRELLACGSRGVAHLVHREEPLPSIPATSPA
nr:MULTISPECIES: NUDIX domain-containing protein [unclassified Acidovorax]